MNGWFPKINLDGVIASGNAGIWITDSAGSRQVDSAGIGPIWAGKTLIYNRNDGTTQVGDQIVSKAYNSYVGSDGPEWAGFSSLDGGQVDFYNGTIIGTGGKTLCNPRFGLNQLGYLAPYQANYRNLVVNNAIIASGVIADFQLGDDLSYCAWQVATGTYTREILTINGKTNIRTDEAPIKTFRGPDGKPWIVTSTGISGGATFIYPFYSNFGYVIYGILMYPDARMIGSKLRVCGSDDKGNASFDHYIDFSTPRVDLRLIDPPIIPPDPPIKPPVSPFYKRKVLS